MQLKVSSRTQWHCGNSSSTNLASHTDSYSKQGRGWKPNRTSKVLVQCDGAQQNLLSLWQGQMSTESWSKQGISSKSNTTSSVYRIFSSTQLHWRNTSKRGLKQTRESLLYKLEEGIFYKPCKLERTDLKAESHKSKQGGAILQALYKKIGSEHNGRVGKGGPFWNWHSQFETSNRVSKSGECCSLHCFEVRQTFCTLPGSVSIHEPPQTAWRSTESSC